MVLPKRALISVSDKTGIAEFAKRLTESGIDILSTGGTAKTLRENGIVARDVSDHTGFPEIMGGRVKTLHPKIHGGILARRDTDCAVMETHGIDAIDLVVVNLYPFQKTVARPDCHLQQAIENIDIGGPTMVRAAAKNYREVIVVVDPIDYDAIASAIEENGVSESLRFDLATKAFAHTATYDSAIADWLQRHAKSAAVEADQKFSATFELSLTKRDDLRYGENPHQSAAFYQQSSVPSGSITAARQLQGKAMSYNNIADSDAALECVKQFTDTPTCVIVKHANPCGVASADSLTAAYRKAFNTDEESAFGGIIAVNVPLDEETATAILEKQFVEVIIAPSVSDAAQARLSEKPNVRVLSSGRWEQDHVHGYDIKRVNGGLLVQDQDERLHEELKVVGDVPPSQAQLCDLEFAWKVAKFVKSNAIVYARDEMTVGVGAGQMSRVNSARIASIKAAHAGLQVKGSAMASDAFFPFRDAIDQAAEDGIAAIIQPGGSIRDQEVIDAANEHGIAMVFTGMRHFRH